MRDVAEGIAELMESDSAVDMPLGKVLYESGLGSDHLFRKLDF
jgi:hypothetical protein